MKRNRTPIPYATELWESVAERGPILFHTNVEVAYHLYNMPTRLPYSTAMPLIMRGSTHYIADTMYCMSLLWPAACICRRKRATYGRPCIGLSRFNKSECALLNMNLNVIDFRVCAHMSRRLSRLCRAVCDRQLNETKPTEERVQCTNNDVVR